MKYEYYEDGIIFWGNSSMQIILGMFVLLQKKVIRLVAGLRNLQTSKNMFREIGILTLPSMIFLKWFSISDSNVIMSRTRIHTIIAPDKLVISCQTAQIKFIQ